MAFTNSHTRRALNPSFYGTMREFHYCVENAHFYVYMMKQWGLSRNRLRGFYKMTRRAYQVWKTAD